MENDPEVWKPILNYEGFYEASSHGNIRRVKGGKGTTLGVNLKRSLCRRGYPMHRLYRGKNTGKTFSCHSLVCSAFHGPMPDGMECCHKDGNKLNSRADNLEWGTPSHNAYHKFLHGTQRQGEQHAGSNLKNRHIVEIFRLRSVGLTPLEIARRFGIYEAAVHNIITRKLWRFVEVPSEYLVFPKLMHVTKKLLNEESIRDMFKLKGCGFTNKRISEMIWVSLQSVNSVFDGKSWVRTVDKIKTGT